MAGTSSRGGRQVLVPVLLAVPSACGQHQVPESRGDCLSIPRGDHEQVVVPAGEVSDGGREGLVDPVPEHDSGSVPAQSDGAEPIGGELLNLLGCLVQLAATQASQQSVDSVCVGGARQRGPEVSVAVAE